MITWAFVILFFLAACNSEKIESRIENTNEDVIEQSLGESEQANVQDSTQSDEQLDEESEEEAIVDESKTSINELEEQLKAEIEELKKENSTLHDKIKSMNSTAQQQNILSKSFEVLQLIKDKDFNELSNHIHPSKGVRFTPYFFVDIPNNQVFTPQQVANLTQDNTVYQWGTFDGTGDTINFVFNDYYNRFIYDEDYLNAHIIGVNTPIGKSNMMDNVAIEYPDGAYIEFHFTGFDPQHDGVDWRSLRLVFQESNGVLYLVSIVHGEWTS
ncbi:hypothetical protein [Sporosarcina sp. OR05]|uniref:hypothetical protein n=1 Tax=Sporosarcina sp. OR05 TaxID=2969819 RepID=UPI00352B6DAD